MVGGGVLACLGDLLVMVVIVCIRCVTDLVR